MSRRQPRRKRRRAANADLLSGFKGSEAEFLEFVKAQGRASHAPSMQPATCDPAEPRGPAPEVRR